MALKKSEKKLLVILAIVVVAAVINFMLEGSAKKKKIAQQTEKHLQQSQVVSGTSNLPETTAPKKELDVSYKTFDNWGKDPFAPIVTSKSRLGSKKKSAQSLKAKHEIKGFFWKNGKAYVLIDDFVFGEGDENNGLSVEKIEGMTVRCQEMNQSFTLNWRESL